MNRVPVELLTDMMRHALGPLFEDDPRRYDASLESIALVSKRWRKIALNDPELSSKIYLDYGTTTKAMDRIIARAQSTSVDITMKLIFDPFIGGSYLVEQADEPFEIAPFVDRLTNKVRPILDRCTILHALAVGDCNTEVLILALHNWKVPRLHSFELDASGESWLVMEDTDDAESYTGHDLFKGDTLHLTTLSLHRGFHIGFKGPYYAHLHTLRLSNFRVPFEPPLARVLDVLESAQQLQHLYLRGIICSGFPTARSVTLHRLISLEIEGAEPMDNSIDIVQALVLPALRLLRLELFDDENTQVFSTKCAPCFHQVAILECELILDHHHSLRCLMEVMPNLERMDTRGTMSAYSWAQMNNNLDHWDRHECIDEVAKIAVMNIAREHIVGEFLCPKLSEIQIGVVDCDGNAEDTLRKMKPGGCFADDLWLRIEFSANTTQRIKIDLTSDMINNMPLETITEIIRYSTYGALQYHPSTFDKASDTCSLVNKQWHAIVIKDPWIASVIYVDNNTTYPRLDKKVARAQETGVPITLYIRLVGMVYAPFPLQDDVELRTVDVDEFMTTASDKLRSIMSKVKRLVAYASGRKETFVVMKAMEYWRIQNLDTLELSVNGDMHLAGPDYSEHEALTLFQDVPPRIQHLAMNGGFHLRFDGPYYSHLTTLTLREILDDVELRIDGVLDALEATTALTELVLSCIDVYTQDAITDRTVVLSSLTKLVVETWGDTGSVGQLVEALRMPALLAVTVATETESSLQSFAIHCRTALKDAKRLNAAIWIESPDGLRSVLQVMPSLETLDLILSHSAYQMHRSFNSYRQEEIQDDIDPMMAVVAIAATHEAGKLLCTGLTRIISQRDTLDLAEVESLTTAAEGGCFSVQLNVVNKYSV
ncbi:hypothetical protein FB451DRAFT_1412826 [Mycena latifolia]|nr:hypothetical protein FB451DRAFT_1412826 [Mycena latifolia]